MNQIYNLLERTGFRAADDKLVRGENYKNRFNFGQFYDLKAKFDDRL